MPSNAELSLYCHQRLRERSADLRRRLSIVTGTPSGRIEQLMSDSGDSLALGAVYRDEAGVTITALRCTAGAQSYAAVRQMVHHLRAIVAEDGPAVIVVDDLTPTPVDQALRDEGFKPEGSAWRAAVDTRVFAPGDPLPQELEDIGWGRLNAHLVRDYERFAWPSKVFSGMVTSYMVPIKPEFARVILGYEEPQGRLIEMNRGAAAARDNRVLQIAAGLRMPGAAHLVGLRRWAARRRASHVLARRGRDGAPSSTAPQVSQLRSARRGTSARRG